VVVVVLLLFLLVVVVVVAVIVVVLVLVEFSNEIFSITRIHKLSGLEYIPAIKLPEFCHCLLRPKYNM
jgi:hypothetical protein